MKFSTLCTTLHLNKGKCEDVLWHCQTLAKHSHVPYCIVPLALFFSAHHRFFNANTYLEFSSLDDDGDTRGTIHAQYVRM